MQVEVDGIQFAYEVRGEGTPILLIHGWSADRRSMLADLEPVFAGRPEWQRTYLDLPGHGATPAPAWLSTQEQMLSLVDGFIDATMPDSPVAVAGNSYDAYLTLARLMPARLRGVALLVPDVPAPAGTRDAPSGHARRGSIDLR